MSDSNLNSCLYYGSVRHRRNEPVHHQFDYGLFMVSLDLEELDTVFEGRWFWSTNRMAFARFRKQDHLIGFGSDSDLDSLRERTLRFLQEHGIVADVGRIQLLTQLRYFGFGMNPVCFYYCYDKSNERLLAVIAEVNNTPWGEQHLYLIQAENAGIDPENPIPPKSKVVGVDHLKKQFHVSPFMGMDMEYRMRFSTPNDTLAVKIENRREKTRLLDVTMKLNRLPLTTRNLNRMLIGYPMMTAKILAAIYWQALRLWIKRVPFCSHPDKSIDAGVKVASARSIVSSDSNGVSTSNWKSDDSQPLQESADSNCPHSVEEETVLASR